MGTCFWFRPQALKKLFQGYENKGWSYHDFPREPNRYDQTILHIIERSYAYFAQDAGFYPVYLYNDEYARIELTNLEFNKTGSADMRFWMNALVMNAVGSPSAGAGEPVIVNYGIKQSLKHLAHAIACRFPGFWGALSPARKIMKKLLRIR